MLYYTLLKNDIDKYIENSDFLYKNLIHPYSFLSLANFYFGVDPNIASRYSKPIQLNNNTISSIRDNDVIFIDSKYFSFFSNNILDNINKKVILVTGRELLPQVNLSIGSEKVLNHSNIKIWFAQNPIYHNSKKYVAIPYGLKSCALKNYAHALHTNSCIKQYNFVSNLPVGVHRPLHKDHIRKKYTELGYGIGPKLHKNQFYQELAKSKWVISTTGDREDCYRHYECIGLGAMPISNVSDQYKNIFGSNMIYANADEMISFVKNKKTPEYFEPNRDLVCTKYYFDLFQKHLMEQN